MVKKDPTAGDLDGFQRQAIEDYRALRAQQGPQDDPKIAAALTTSVALGRIATRLVAASRLEVLLDNLYRDPSRAVSWLRQFRQIQDNLAQADDQILKGQADQQFEEALKAMRDQLPPLEGGEA